MKNSLFLPLSLIALLTVSCKKEYVCECKTVDNGGTLVTTTQIPKASKSDAKAMCGNSTAVYNSTAVNSSGTPAYYNASTTTCELK